MRNKLDAAYLAVLLISIPGYPLLAAVVSASGMDGAFSSFASMIMRAANVGLALILIVASLNRRRDNSSDDLIRILLIFWIAYLVRIFFDTIYDPGNLSQEPSYYWIWAVGGSFVPMLALALKPHRIDEADRYFRRFYVVTLVAGVIALFAASGAMVDDLGRVAETGRGRVGDNRLNPIALGHLGAMLAIQSIWAIVFFRPWRRLIIRAMLLSGLGVGFYLLLIANSRGPILAALACMVIVALSVQFRYKAAILLFLGLTAAPIVPLARYLEEAHNISTFSRLFGMSISEHFAQSSRLDLFGAALDGLRDHPWMGSSLETPNIGGYPHNVIIESFMALGIFFGVLLVIIFLLLSMRVFSRFSKYPQCSWPGLLFFQYLIGAQFSGSLYGSTYLWASVGLVVSFSMAKYAARPVTRVHTPFESYKADHSTM